MATMAEYRRAVALRFAELMDEGRFVGQQGAVPLGGLPCTASNGGYRSLSHVNALIAMQVMRDRELTDPRVFTAAQIDALGFQRKQNAEQILIGWQSREVMMQYQMPDSGKAVRFHVYLAADIDGLTPWQRLPDFRLEHLALALSAPADRLVPALDEMVGAAGHRGEDALMRRQLLGVWLEAATGESGAHAHLSVEEWRQLASWIKTEPKRLFSAITDAEQLFAIVAEQARSVQFEREQDHGRKGTIRTPAVVAGQEGDMSTGDHLQRIRELYESRQAVLAVPFSDKDKAYAKGAVWHPEHKFWFVPAGIDVAPFVEWKLEGGLSRTATDSEVISAFEKAMTEMGLRIPPKGINSDGDWHNVAVDKKSPNNAGAYKLVLAGNGVDTPYGKISNKDSGARVSWIYEGEFLTPEQRKRLMDQARAREAEARKAEAARHNAAAEVAVAVFESASDPTGHPYARKKGVGVERLRQIGGSELLKHPECFVGEDGKTRIRPNLMYLLVPMTNEAGQIRAVQAIAPDGTKTFMRGAQKSGLMLVLGAPSLDALKEREPGHVSYCEGYATGWSFRQGLPGPTIVTFDAGNMETVMNRTASRIPQNTTKVVAIDNDQFYVERALSTLAERLGVNIRQQSGTPVCIVSRHGRAAQLDGATRSIDPGAVIMDGEWHQAPKGRYRVALRYENDGVSIRSLRVEMVEAEYGGKSRQSNIVFNNRGAEVGKYAMELGGKFMVIAPSFASLEGRPTDWNDLAQREGMDALKQAIGSQIEESAFARWLDTMKQNHGSEPKLDEAPRVPSMRVAGQGVGR